MVFINGSDLERAEMAARRAVDLVPTDGSFLHRLAWIQEARGNLVDATENMRLAVQCSPNAPHLKRLLSDYESRSGVAV